VADDGYTVICQSPALQELQRLVCGAKPDGENESGALCANLLKLSSPPGTAGDRQESLLVHRQLINHRSVFTPAFQHPEANFGLSLP